MSFLVCRLLLVFPLGTPKPHNEYFSHNDRHNEVPSVPVYKAKPFWRMRFQTMASKKPNRGAADAASHYVLQV